MAFAFEFKPVATIKAKQLNSTEMHIFTGVTTATITPNEAATQINKLLAVGDRQIVADENMTRTLVEEVYDNG